jgi:hypothetical protein
MVTDLVYKFEMIFLQGTYVIVRESNASDV